MATTHSKAVADTTLGGTTASMSDHCVIDLTSSPETDAAEKKMPSRNWHEPIGVDITFDVVDLVDDVSSEARITYQRREAAASKIPAKPTQTHPRKIIEASKKRKREREEARKREEEARRQAELERRAEEIRKKNLQNGVNFILVDDSSDEEGESDHDEPSLGDGKQQTEKAPSAAHANPSRPAAPTTEWVYHASATKKKRKPSTAPKASSQASNASSTRATYFNYEMSHEDAAALQERMFREAAERLRARAPSPARQSNIYVFQRPIITIHQVHPDHWQWSEPYACLGLPPNASHSLVKSHYRALARVYHPDKSKEANTTRKFQGIARAYHRLTQSTGHVETRP